MYLAGFGYLIDDSRYAILLTGVFVLLCQVKINVTNAYAGSLAWSNFFSRLTHSHPGRVVWLIFNVLIAFLLAVLGVFDALEHILGMYSCVAVAWIGALVADLIINKPLGLSPRHIEFKRAHLHAINPVGVVSMVAGSLLGIIAFGGHFGPLLRAFAPLVSLATAFALAPCIAWSTRGRYYLARRPGQAWKPGQTVHCVVCGKPYEAEDMAHCPAYGGAICSLCCTLDARCHDRCKPHTGMPRWLSAALARYLPSFSRSRAARRLSQFLLIYFLVGLLIAIIVGLVYQQELIAAEAGTTRLDLSFLRIYAVFIVLAAVGVWWLVLANESRRVAQEETERQTQLLLKEIAAHRRTDAQLQQAKEVADGANAAKSRYVRGISHELRTPLNNILGYAQILQREASGEKRWKNALSTIQRSGEHLLALIDGLLDIARIEAGRLQVQRREVRFEEFLEHIEHMFRLEAEKKALGFDWDCPRRLPAVVLMDENLLRQILINLLANAVRYTETGRIGLEVTYRWGVARFAVRDTGCGIAPGDLDRIFLPFERVATHAGAPGTGLGLTITRQLIDMLGGEITVRSEPGQGSEFTVKLYLPSIGHPQLDARPEREISGYLGPRRRILVVDDQPEQSRLLGDLLRPRGFEVETENEPTQVLARVLAAPPDLIFLDVAMPGMDGWTLCRQLRGAGYIRPILMVSANAYDNLPDLKQEAGCDDFIVKPVLESILFARLYAWLGLQWTYRAPLEPTPKALRTPAPAATAPTPPPVSVEDLALPPTLAQALQPLQTAAEIGHLQGVEDALETLAACLGQLAPDPQWEALLAQWRRDAHDLQFERLLKPLSTLLAAAPSHAHHEHV